jgi:hypothetical protein
MAGNFVQGDYFVLGKPGKPRRWPAVILAAALLAALVFVPAIAHAAKGGNGHGHGHGNIVTAPSVASVTASPNPADASSRVWLDGCGYEVEPVVIHIVHSVGYTEICGAGMWYTGCFSGYFTASEAGTYTIEVYQSSSGQSTLMASTELVGP